MKESMGNIDPKKQEPGNKSRGTLRNLLFTVLAAGSMGSTAAQENKTTLQNTTNKIENSINEDVYKKLENYKKEVTDEEFNSGFMLKTPSLNSEVIQTIQVQCHGLKDISVEVETDTTTEEFESLEQMTAKYPEFTDTVNNTIAIEYERYQEESAWGRIIAETENSLKNDFEKYIPSDIEISILKDCAELKNKGGTTDGFDEIYHYYIDQFKSHEDEYAFDITHQGTAFNLAKYMVNKYYSPLLKN